MWLLLAIFEEVTYHTLEPGTEPEESKATFLAKTRSCWRMDIYLQEVNDTGMINLKHSVVYGSAGRLRQWIGLEKLSDLVVLQCSCPSEPAFVVAPEFLRDLLALTALKALRLENLCWSKVGIFPPDLRVCTNLQELTLSSYNSSKARKPTSAILDFGKYLPESVLKIDLSACPKLLGGSAAITSMSSLTNLQNLNLRACWEIEDLTGLCELISLQMLNVGITGITELPHDFRKLKHLRVLDVSYCKKLRSIGNIAHATSLQHVNASYCEILKELPNDFSYLQKLKKVDLRNNKLLCTLPKDYERLARGRIRNGKILEARGCWGLIMPLVKKLRCTKMSHVNCVIPCNTGRDRLESWIDATKNVKHEAAYALLKEVVSDYEFGGVHWTYQLDDGDEIDFLIKALCEHDNRGAKRTNRLANVVAEVTSNTNCNAGAQWWVAVATAPCTFGVLTERAMLKPWNKTLLHYTVVCILPEFFTSADALEEYCVGDRWLYMAIKTLLRKCKGKLEEASIQGIYPMRSSEGKKVVDTFLREIRKGYRPLDGYTGDSSSIVWYNDPEYEDFDYDSDCEDSRYSNCYKSLFPNFPFGRLLQSQNISLTSHLVKREEEDGEGAEEDDEEDVDCGEEDGDEDDEP